MRACHPEPAGRLEHTAESADPVERKSDRPLLLGLAVGRHHATRREAIAKGNRCWCSAGRATPARPGTRTIHSPDRWGIRPATADRPGVRRSLAAYAGAPPSGADVGRPVHARSASIGSCWPVTPAAGPVVLTVLGNQAFIHPIAARAVRPVTTGCPSAGVSLEVPAHQRVRAWREPSLGSPPNLPLASGPARPST